MPSQPPLASDVRAVASGAISFNIAPGEARMFEAATLASDRGATPPPNAALSWTVAWRATESLTSAWYRQTSRTELGRGRWGTADMGAVGFELRNTSGATIYGELNFLIGSR
jgi:hypothetical protein